MQAHDQINCKHIWAEDALTHGNLTEKAKNTSIDTYALIWFMQ